MTAQAPITSARRSRIGVAVFWLVGCGGPVLQNAPRPNPAAVAGAAAAAAAAITLEDPDAAARKSEAAKSDQRELRPIEVHERVPEAAFDRLDAQRAGDSAGNPPPEVTSSGPVPPAPKRAAPITPASVPSPKQAAEQQR